MKTLAIRSTSILILLTLCLIVFSSCGCSHDWQDPTCEKAGYCALCGETNVDSPAHGHSWVDASCSAAKTCSVCQKTEGDPLPHTLTLGHCSVCNHITDSTREQLDSIVKAGIILQWTLKYKTTVKISNVTFDSINFQNNLYSTKGSAICEQENEKYIVSFSISAKASTQPDSEYDIVLNKVEEISGFFECDENGNKLSYTFTDSKKFKHSKSGVVVSVIDYLSDGTGTQYVFTYAGVLASTSSFTYEMFKTPTGDFEIHTTSKNNGYKNINYYFTSPTEGVVIGEDAYLPAY